VCVYINAFTAMARRLLMVIITLQLLQSVATLALVLYY
jgi:hypothetical protein